MSKHHPDEVTLLDYSAGTLAMPQSLAVAMHLFLCDSCRAQVKKLNSLGGALLEQSEPRQVKVRDFDQFMAGIDKDGPSESASAIEVPQASALRNPLHGFLPKRLEDIQWRQQTREIAEYDLTERLGVSGFRIGLQKISAGARVPEHTHKGRELTVVLSGGFSDELGVYHEGDFVSRDGSHQHSPTALQNEDCICLTVLDAPLRFLGLYRLLNPFMHWS